MTHGTTGAIWGGAFPGGDPTGHQGPITTDYVFADGQDQLTIHVRSTSVNGLVTAGCPENCPPGIVTDLSVTITRDGRYTITIGQNTIYPAMEIWSYAATSSPSLEFHYSPWKAFLTGTYQRGPASVAAVAAAGFSVAPSLVVPNPYTDLLTRAYLPNHR